MLLFSVVGKKSTTNAKYPHSKVALKETFIPTNSGVILVNTTERHTTIVMSLLPKYPHGRSRPHKCIGFY